MMLLDVTVLREGRDCQSVALDKTGANAICWRLGRGWLDN